MCKFTDPTTKQIVESLGEYWRQNKMRVQFVHSGIDLEQNDEEREKIEKALSTQNLGLVKRWASGKRGKEKEKAEYVYYIAKLMHDLSEDDIWVEEETGEKKVKFADLLENFLETGSTMPMFTSYPNVQKALDALKLARLKITDDNQREYRSNWYRALQIKGNETGDLPKIIHIARYIIDLCYNISVESGILGVYLPYMADKQRETTKDTNKDEIRKRQCDYVAKKLLEHLEPEMSALFFPPWEDAVAQMKAIGITKEEEDSEQKEWNLNKIVAVRIVQDILIVIVWIALTIVLNVDVFPCIDAILIPIFSDTFGIRLVYTMLSPFLSGFLTTVLERLVLRAINHIWPRVYIKEFGIQILDGILKLLHRQMRINSYLKRAGLESQHGKN